MRRGRGVMRKIQLILGALLVTCLTAAAASIPRGTNVSVRLGQTISSATAKSGDSWSGTLARAIVIDGETRAKRGATVHGKVVEAKASGRLSGKALIELQITSVAGIPVISDTVSSEGGGHTGRNA